jgi:hypothetical protein
VSEEAIRKAVEAGHAEYWRPMRETDDAVRAWKLAGSKGDRPETRGQSKSIVDCISDSVNQMLTAIQKGTGHDES